MPRYYVKTITECTQCPHCFFSAVHHHCGAKSDNYRDNFLPDGNGMARITPPDWCPLPQSLDNKNSSGENKP